MCFSDHYITGFCIEYGISLTLLMLLTVLLSYIVYYFLVHITCDH